MESVLETKAATILQFARTTWKLHVTFEKGTCATSMHDLPKSHVTEVLVCNPKRTFHVLIRADISRATDSARYYP